MIKEKNSIYKKKGVKNIEDSTNVDKNFLGYYIYRWLNNSKIRCKKTTFSNYEYMVNSKIIPRFSKIRKSDITVEMIDDYTTNLLNSGLLPKTVKDILIVLKQILKTAEINIEVTMPRVPKHEIQILSKDEQKKLEKFLLENMDIEKFGIYLCLYTGLRIGEVCALEWENIDIKNKKIIVKKTITRIKNQNKDSKNKTEIIIDDPKSASSIREIPIPNFIINLLINFSKDVEPNNFLLTGTNKFIESRTYHNKYKKILKQINMESYNFHVLRHTFATRCIENGSDPKTLSEVLGHSNVKITLDRYVHPTYENKVKMMNNLKPLYV